MEDPSALRCSCCCRAPRSPLTLWRRRRRRRQSVIQAMDIVGGAGISKGPSNFLTSAYIGIPIAITVEGANALTRSLIVFGQVPHAPPPPPPPPLHTLTHPRPTHLLTCSWRLAPGPLGIVVTPPPPPPQGLNRSHPHLLNLIETIRAGNDLEGFNRSALRPRPPPPPLVSCRAIDTRESSPWLDSVAAVTTVPCQ